MYQAFCTYCVLQVAIGYVIETNGNETSLSVLPERTLRGIRIVTQFQETLVVWRNRTMAASPTHTGGE